MTVEIGIGRCNGGLAFQCDVGGAVDVFGDDTVAVGDYVEVARSAFHIEEKPWGQRVP